MSLEYLNFDILLQRDQEELSARVIASPAGEAAVRFSLPPGLDAVAESGGQWSGDAVRASGTALFEAVFSGEVLVCYRRSRDEARRRGRGLRLRFRLGNAPELGWVPWEFLHDPQMGFLALSVETTVVRYLELPEPARPPRLTLPLRVLALISSPDDYPRLDVEREWAALQEALEPLRRSGHLELERLDDARLEALHERLQVGRFDVLHFIGHSGLDSTGEAGLVVLEADSTRGRAVSAEAFRAVLADRALRLVVLNSCESARAGSLGLPSGLAQGLVRSGIPAVVAMQFPIRDAAARTLTTALYRGLLLSSPVDAAVAEARKSVFPLGDAAWATPVVFLRAREGRIFAQPPPSLGRRIVQWAPYALSSANWLLLLYAVKRIGFYFTQWWTYAGIVSAGLAGVAALTFFIPANWVKLIPGLLTRPNGRLRPLRALASVALSAVFLGSGLRSQPEIELAHVRRADIDAGRALETPSTTAGVYGKNLCEPSDSPSSGTGPAEIADCEPRLPRDGFLKLEYRLGLSRVSSYCVKLSVEPAEAVGLAALRTDPAFGLLARSSYSDPSLGVQVRARTAGNYELYITSGKDAGAGDLTGTIEIRLLARELYPGRAGPMPRLRATFATDIEGRNTVDALSGCWSLLDGGRIDCSAFASGGSR